MPSSTSCLRSLVRRGDQAHVDGDRVLAADALDLLLLDHAQDLGLRLQRHVADLVEEERSAVRLLELPGAPIGRAREGALLVPEELALEEVLGDRGAVDVDERAVGPVAHLVHEPGDELLAGAVLAVDQDAGRRRRDLLDDRAHLFEAGALPDHAPRRVGQAVLEGLVLALQPVHLEQVADGQEDPVAVEGLLEEVVGAPPRGFHRGFDRSVARDHHDRQVRPPLVEVGEDLEPVPARHLDVEEDQLRILGEGGEAGLAVRRQDHLVALVAQDEVQALADVLVVVDDQDLHGGPPVFVSVYQENSYG